VVGANFRIDALQAALIRVKLKRLDGYTAKRQKNAALYTRLFEESGIAAPNLCSVGCGPTCRTGPSSQGAKVLLPVSCQSRHIYNQYVVRIPGAGTRDQLQAFLRERKVGTEIYYPVPMHLQKCFASLNCPAGTLPVAEAAARETLALPIFPELTDDEIHYVVEQVIAFFR
jgi:dTDP-4-amino-4,6-dideoxygalactose transaminase